MRTHTHAPAVTAWLPAVATCHRRTGLTEIRGPYYTHMGPQHLTELLQSVGHAVDGLKFAGRWLWLSVCFMLLHVCSPASASLLRQHAAGRMRLT